MHLNVVGVFLIFHVTLLVNVVLPIGYDNVLVLFFSLQFHKHSDRQTFRQTDRQTDIQTFHIFPNFFCVRENENVFQQETLSSIWWNLIWFLFVEWLWVWILWVLQFVVVHLQVLLCLHFLYKIHTLVLLVHLQMLQVRKWTNNFTETWENESMNGELTLILTWIVLTLFEFLGSLVNSTLIQCGQIPLLPSVSAYLNMNQSASINTSFAITFNGKMVASIDNFLVYGNDNTSL